MIAAEEEEDEADAPQEVDFTPYDSSCSVTGVLSALWLLLCFKCAPNRLRNGSTPERLEEYYEHCRRSAEYTEEEATAWDNLRRQRVQAGTPIVAQWSDIYPILTTGDLIGFRDPDHWSSSTVALFTGELTHIGMVVVKHCVNPKTQRRVKHILLWEAVNHWDGLIDYGTGDESTGVRLISLQKRLLASKSLQFYVTKLAHPGGEARIQALNDAFDRVYEQEQGKPYSIHKCTMCCVPFSGVPLCGAACIGGGGGSGGYAQSSDSYFCSELVCYTLQQMGLIDPKLNPQVSVPSDFWEIDRRYENGSRVALLFYMPRLDHPECCEVIGNDLAAAPPQQRVFRERRPHRVKEL